jgi:hypothetical protein
LIANPTLTSICINGFNGFGTTGGSCSTGVDPGGNGPGYDNGPGVVEASTIDGAGVNDCGNIAPCSGMAFIITYKAMAAIGSTNLFFPTSPPNPVASACGVSSVSSPVNVCVLVASYPDGSTLPENIQGETVCVNKCPSSTATQIYDASTSAPWSGVEVTGASTYDTSVVKVPVSITPGGSVTYTYFMTGDCTGAGTLESPVGGSLLFGGGVPNSMTVGPLAAGPYSFQAAYSGDSNYLGSTSPCETFTVNKAPTTTTMVLSETVGSGANAVTWTVPSSGGFTLGALLHVSATVGIPIVGFVIGGTITYSYITGSLPPGVSPPDYGGPSLSAGRYCVAATYSGDSNYLGSTTSVCFNVASMNLGGGGKAFRD